MHAITIAAAQSGSIRGDLRRNRDDHLRYIRAASRYQADLILFPELSLTGYEPDLAGETALGGNEDILAPLKKASHETGMTIVTGCPVRSGKPKPYIGAFIFQPGENVQVYRKQYLHAGEDRFFIPYKGDRILRVKDETIGIGICADIDNPAHPAAAHRLDATIYAAGVLITPNGIRETETRLSGYSRKYGFLTVVTNFATPSGGFETAGRSAIWNERGKIIIQIENAGEALIIAEKRDGNWHGRNIHI